MREPGCATCSFRAKYDEKKTIIEKYNFPATKFA